MNSENLETVKRAVAKLEEIREDVFQILNDATLSPYEKEDVTNALMCLCDAITEIKYIGVLNDE